MVDFAVAIARKRLYEGFVPSGENHMDMLQKLLK